jgi:hypothetical protein
MREKKLLKLYGFSNGCTFVYVEEYVLYFMTRAFSRM